MRERINLHLGTNADDLGTIATNHFDIHVVAEKSALAKLRTSVTPDNKLIFSLSFDSARGFLESLAENAIVTSFPITLRDGKLKIEQSRNRKRLKFTFD